LHDALPILSKSFETVSGIGPKFIQRDNPRLKKGNQIRPVILIKNAYSVNGFANCANGSPIFIVRMQVPVPFFSQNAFQINLVLEKLLIKKLLNFDVRIR